MCPRSRAGALARLRRAHAGLVLLLAALARLKNIINASRWLIFTLLIAPAGLGQDSAEPSLAAAVDRAVEEGRLLALGRTGRRERRRAIPFRRRGRAEVLLVVCPRRARVVAAVLRRSFWMLQSSHIICEAREEKRDSNLHCGGVEGLCVGEFLISERLQTRFSSAVSLKRCSVP